MAKQVKIDRVAALKERIASSDALLLTEYRGLTVHETASLRRSLSGIASFAVVKNTLMKRATGEAGLGEEVADLLNGPTAVAFVTGDVVAAAKRISEAAKVHPALILKGAYFEGRVLGEADAKALASLDSREVMLSKIAGMLQSEMTRAASMFQAIQGQFLSLLEAYKGKLPAGEAPSAPAATEAVTEAAVVAEAESAPEAVAEAPEAGAEAPAPADDEPAAEADGAEGEE